MCLKNTDASVNKTNTIPAVIATDEKAAANNKNSIGRSRLRRRRNLLAAGAATVIVRDGVTDAKSVPRYCFVSRLRISSIVKPTSGTPPKTVPSVRFLKRSMAIS